MSFDLTPSELHTSTHFVKWQDASRHVVVNGANSPAKPFRNFRLAYKGFNLCLVIFHCMDFRIVGVALQDKS